MITKDSIKQIERKSNPKAGVCGDRPAHRPHARHQHDLQKHFQRGGKQHGERGTACPPQPRQAGREDIRPRNGGRRKGRRTDEGNKERAFSLGKGGIEQGCDAPRAEEEHERTGEDEKERRPERKERAFFRRPRLPPGRERRERGNGRRRKPPRRRSGKRCERERPARKQSVGEHGPLSAPEKAGKKHAVHGLREGQDAGGRHHWQHDGHELRRPLPRPEIGNAALAPEAEEEIYERRALAQRDGEEREPGGTRRIPAEEKDKEHPEPRLHKRFKHLRERRGCHPAPSLEVPAEDGDDGAEEDGGRKKDVPRRKVRPLQRGEHGRQQRKEHPSRPAQSHEQAEPRKECSPSASAQSALPRDDAGERRPRPRRREHQKETEEGICHLIEPHPHPREERSKDDAIDGADALGDDRPQRNGRRPTKKAKMFHYV